MLKTTEIDRDLMWEISDDASRTLPIHTGALVVEIHQWLTASESLRKHTGSYERLWGQMSGRYQYKRCELRLVKYGEEVEVRVLRFAKGVSDVRQTTFRWAKCELEGELQFILLQLRLLECAKRDSAAVPV